MGIIGGDGGGGEDREIIDTVKQPLQEQQQPPPQQQNKTTTTTTTTTAAENNNNRYWMRDLYKYSYPRNYGGASGLYNLAWAQAVQNKPLNDVLVELETKDDNKNGSKTNKNGDDAGVKQEGGDKDDSDKEEGELEEGEIDGDFGDDTDGGNNNGSDDKKKGNSKMEIEDGELEIQVSSIRKVLDNVTVSETHKSFDIVCARLRSSLESLRELVLHTWFPSKDDLIQQSFSALLCVNSVFSSMSPTLRDQNRDKMSRLLTFVTSLSSVLFTPDQRKEAEAMMVSVNPPPPTPPPAQPKPKPSDRQERLPITSNKAILTDSNTLSVSTGNNTSDVLSGVGSVAAVHQFDKLDTNSLSVGLKPLQTNVNFKGSGFGPLDPHKVHDEDSLPSPTSKTTPSQSFSKPTPPPQVAHALHNSLMHPYETEAMKAISSYQQKFGRSSFLTQDRLPSPTPSEDGNDGAVDDHNEEVSSFSTSNNDSVKNANPPMLMQSTSSLITASSPITHALVSGTSAGVSSVGTNPTSRGPVKSRDPRLRHHSPNVASVDLSFCPTPVVPVSTTPKLEPLVEIMNHKKKPEGPVIDSPAPKRQRNGVDTTSVSVNVNEEWGVPRSVGSDTSGLSGPLASRGSVGPLTDPRKSIGGPANSGISSAFSSASVSTTSQPISNISSTDPLQSFLKGFAGNPAALISILKEQQKLSEPLPIASHSVNSNSVQMQLSLPTSTPTISSGAGRATAVSLQSPSPIAVMNPQEDPAKPRMKPRDPRRALQSNAIKKTVNNVSDSRNINGVHNPRNQGVQENISSQGPGSNTTPASYSLAPELPDISKQFTKNLKNIADIITAPLSSTLQSPPATSSESVPVNPDRASVKSEGTVNSAELHVLRPGEVIAGHSQSQNQWKDVEHLFDGYDAQQKAAIQQERARRMDEQKKMFDERKLCLVLDLDHTLLNSAKFAEVDPRHDEILRKKEEHDREQPRRHLFRFQHMGMWTKLRPGIWNFLEKASKLYELHLYTMGNKLYATEMAKVLDPKGQLFSGRVISRGDDGEPLDGDDRAPKSKDLEGVLGMESAVVIIDDSVRVWPHNKLNLIVVERYLYFPCSRRHFGLSGPSLLDCDRDERPEDGTLACCLGVVERIHQNFFANQSLDDLDVRNILASEQRKVLAGCRILFSRVFPVGEANPHLYPLWQTAEQFGAVCTNQIDDQVTHVVANAPGTDKVNWALSTGRFAVYPSWVEASAVLYRRASEQDFAIKP